VERAAFAAGEAAGVENVGDLGVGVMGEEFVDGGDHVGWGLAQLPAGLREGQGQAPVLAAAQSDVGGDVVVGLEQGDVGDEQPDHAFAFALWGGGVVPEGWEVGG
jgi:hypothetical protein